MFTRILTPSATAAALLLGAVSQNAAAAMDEIVVNGAEVLAQVQARQQMFRSEMAENKRSIDEWIKATLHDGVKPAGVPNVNLASTVQEEPVRG